jgi:hypothetical protein
MLSNLLARTHLWLPLAGLTALVGCTSYPEVPPYKFEGTSSSPTITFRSDFPTWTSVSRMTRIDPEGKNYCVAQPVGYTKQPGFDRRNLMGRDFGDPAKPNDEVVFKVEENKKITLQVETILAQYDKFIHKCGPYFIKFIPLPATTYSMRFVKDGNACTVDIRSGETAVAAEILPLSRDRRTNICD